MINLDEEEIAAAAGPSATSATSAAETATVSHLELGMEQLQNLFIRI